MKHLAQMAHALSSRGRLFDDDTISYLTIKSELDSKIFQNDLDKLAQWQKTWEMNFYPDK